MAISGPIDYSLSRNQTPNLVISAKEHKLKHKVQAVEVLNPQKSAAGDQFKPISSGTEADSEELDDETRTGLVR
jgi:hypothetical protein